MVRIALLLVLSAVAAPAGAAEVNLLDGTTVVGEVTAWDIGKITVETADGPREFARSRLIDVRWPRGAASPEESSSLLRFELTDGSRLPAAAFVMADRVATFVTPTYSKRPLKVRADSIHRIELQPSDAVADLWRQLDERELAGDVLLVASRDGAKLDYLTGVVGNVTSDEVAFDYDGQHLNVKRSRVAAIQLYHAGAARERKQVFELTLIDGSTIPVLMITFADGTLKLLTPEGARLNVSLDRVERADFSAGKLSYLSYIKPLSVKWMPRIAAPAAASLIADYGRPRNDVSYTGSPLTLAWADEGSPTGREIRTFARGLALRSRTDVAWRIPDGMKRFVTTAGIDPATSDQGHVLLEIRADERILWEGEIDGSQDPVVVDVSLGSARRLQIRVDYGRNLDFGDRLHLVEARVTK